MKKRILSLIVVLSMLIVFMPVIAHAATSGTCGDNVTWTLDDNGTLTISGTGDMENYVAYNSSPFYDNGSIKSIIIEKGITSISDYAFRSCDNLTSITIPDSVTTIGYMAFYGCSGLTSVLIPDSVTSICASAFRYCGSLTSVTIPNSITSIEADTFDGCSLTSIAIPDSVTIIGACAFFNCSGLTSVTIPDSVTIIGQSAFAGSGLTSVTIPDSVTSIANWAFQACDSLTSINVDSSNKNYCSIDGNLFNKNKTELIQYANGKTEKEYIIPNSVTNIENNAFRGCDNLISIKIPDSVVNICWGAFILCSSLTRIEISNSVTTIDEGAFNYCNGLTDVYYSGSETQWKSINIDRYNECLTNATISYAKTGTFGTTNSTSVDAPIITSAKIGDKNLFTDKLNIDKDSATSYSVEGAVDANGCEDVHLYITQGSKKSIEIPLNACKDIQIGKEFSAGQPIYMTAIDKKTGKSTSKRTKLSVVGNKMFEGSLSSGAIKIIEDFSVDIPEDVPVLGEQSFGLSLGSISSEVEIDGNEFKVSLGTDFFEREKDSDGKWKKEDWEGFKQGFKSAKDDLKKNAGRYSNMRKMMKKYNSKAASMELSKGVDSNANITGYIEGYIDDSGLHPTEGGIIVSAEIKYKYQGMTVVAIIPVYYEIGASGEVKFVGGVKDLVPGNGLQGVWTGSITPAVSFEVGGGFGVPKVFTIGASGKVKAELEIALDKIYQKLDVTGTANFKLTGLFGVEYKKPFAEGTFHIYETGNKNTLLGKKFKLYSVDENANDIYSYIDIDAPLATVPHDDSTQNWVGDEEQIQLFTADYTNQEINVLEENSYENIAPVFAKMNGKNVIAWITDNKSRADGDKTMLVYSVEENGKWSAPKTVNDDGLADYSPVMKDGYIVWQKAVGKITSDMTARDLGAVCEIYMAKWNGNGFDEPIRITENSLIDQTPTLTVNNGVPTVVWVQNSENDFTGLTGENRIMSYTNGEVSTEQSVNNAVTYLDCTYIDNGLNIAYETDGDKDLSTLEDREIYTVSKGRQTQLTDNNLVDTHPVYADFNGNKTLFYYSNGKIVYLDNGTEKVVKNSGVATDQFAVVSNNSDAAVLWTAVNDGTAEIHGALYAGTEWSEDVQISDLGQRVKYPSAVMNDDGSIFAVFNRTEKVSDGDDYYVDGQSDLCTINVVPSYDLELTDAYFDEEAMTAYATVKNNGELAINGYTVTLADNQKTVSESLKAGESAEIEMAYNKPENLTKRDIELSVAMANGEEYNTENNTAVFSIGNADIAVENVTVNEDETTVSAEILNIGYDNTKNVKIQLRDGSADGTVIEEKTINLAVGAAESVEFAIDKSAMLFFEVTKQLYITAEYDGDEISVGNNDGYVVIMSASGAADYETEILSYNKIYGKYMINSIARNNTDNAVSCIMYSAVYSSDGILKACGTVKADIEADNDTGVDITVPCTIETGDTVKTFMWTDKLEPLAKMGELVIE